MISEPDLSISAETRHTWQKGPLPSSTWTCSVCGARCSYYDCGRDMDDGASWDCDVEVTRQVMLS